MQQQSKETGIMTLANEIMQTIHMIKRQYMHDVESKLTGIQSIFSRRLKGAQHSREPPLYMQANDSKHVQSEVVYYMQRLFPRI